MTFLELKNCEFGLTHAGTFHSDDVFSVAFLKMINPDIKIVRSYVVPEDFKGIIFDVGFGEFDHHQADNECREDGVPYASFGKLWKAFAPSLYSEEVVAGIDKNFIESLDNSDNTGRENAVAFAISTFNPLWDSDSNGDKEFERAVEWASVLLENVIKTELKRVEMQTELLDIYKKTLNKKIIVLDRFMPFKKALWNTEAVFVIYPSKRGGYQVQGVPINADTVELKKAFPKEWCEKPPKGVTFCHNSRFLISVEDKETAIRLCEELL